MRPSLVASILTIGLAFASTGGVIAAGGAGGGPGRADEAQYKPCPPASPNPGGSVPCGCRHAIIVGVAGGGGCGAAIAASGKGKK